MYKEGVNFITEGKSALTPSYFNFLHKITCILFLHCNAKQTLMAVLNHP